MKMGQGEGNLCKATQLGHRGAMTCSLPCPLTSIAAVPPPALERSPQIPSYNRTELTCHPISIAREDLGGVTDLQSQPFVVGISDRLHSGEPAPKPSLTQVTCFPCRVPGRHVHSPSVQGGTVSLRTHTS